MSKQVTMTDDGPSAQRAAGHTWTPGDTYELEDSIADALTDMEHFVEGDQTVEEESEEEGAVESGDVTSEFPGEDDWLEPEYEERVEAVESGEADSYLDEVEEVERSQQVLDAVEDRREELEG